MAVLFRTPATHPIFIDVSATIVRRYIVFRTIGAPMSTIFADMPSGPVTVRYPRIDKLIFVGALVIALFASMPTAGTIQLPVNRIPFVAVKLIATLGTRWSAACGTLGTSDRTAAWCERFLAIGTENIPNDRCARTRQPEWIILTWHLNLSATRLWPSCTSL